MENINSMATYYEQSLSGNIKSLTVCGPEAPSLEKGKMKTNYDQLAAVLKLWYSDEQIQEIWKLLKDYDDQLMDQTKITKDK